MNRLELVRRLSDTFGDRISKADLDRIITHTFDEIVDACERGESVTLIGFGTFKGVDCAARTGRNPSTGELIHIPAQRKPKFIPGARFKEVLNPTE